MKIYSFRWHIPYNRGMEGQRYYTSEVKATKDRVEALKRMYDFGADRAESYVSDIFEIEVDDSDD